MSEENCIKPGHFRWNEFVTPDVEAAKKFYCDLLGWTTQPFGEGVDYTLFKKGDEIVGGLMESAIAEMRPQWVSYVTVENVDATAKHAVSLGGKIIVEPFDMPHVGRIAVIHDAQDSAFGLFSPAS